MKLIPGGLLLAAIGAMVASLWSRYSLSTEYSAPPPGQVILMMHKDIPSLRRAANALASVGLYVLVGVGSQEMKRRFTEEAVKGVEVVVADLQEPSHVAHIVYRSKEIARDLHRPLVGLAMLYPGNHLERGYSLS